MPNWEKLWEDYWRATHKPDANGEYYFDRQRRAEQAEKREARRPDDSPDDSRTKA